MTESLTSYLNPRHINHDEDIIINILREP